MDEITLRNWRENNTPGEPFDYRQELEKEEVVELIRDELKKVSSYIPSYARPRRFFILPHSLTPDNEFATPKLSIKVCLLLVVLFVKKKVYHRMHSSFCFLFVLLSDHTSLFVFFLFYFLTTHLFLLATSSDQAF